MPPLLSEAGLLLWNALPRPGLAANGSSQAGGGGGGGSAGTA